jgi:hypothetical protein
VSSARDLAPRDYAARTGASFNPDQFLAGLHLQLGPDVKPELRPVLTLELGNGVRLASLSGDVLCHFEGARWAPYVGGGPGLNFIDVTDGVGEADGITAKLVAHAVTGLVWRPQRSPVPLLRRGTRRRGGYARFPARDRRVLLSKTARIPSTPRWMEDDFP